MQWASTKCGKYKIQTLSAANFDGALEVIREAFCQDEAVSIGSEVNRSPAARAELLELCADTALDGASLVCTHASTGRVIGAAFNKIQVPATESGEESFFDLFARERCKDPSSQSLIRFMATVDAKCNLFKKYNVDCSLEIMFLATLEEHRGLGISTLLCQESVKLAELLQNGPVSALAVRDLGQNYSFMLPRHVETKRPKIVQALFTSCISQKIGRKLGFTMDMRVSYDEFFINGKTYAERIGPESPYCEVVSKVVPRIK